MSNPPNLLPLPKIPPDFLISSARASSMSPWRKAVRRRFEDERRERRGRRVSVPRGSVSAEVAVPPGAERDQTGRKRSRDWHPHRNEREHGKDVPFPSRNEYPGMFPAPNALHTIVRQFGRSVGLREGVDALCGGEEAHDAWYSRGASGERAGTATTVSARSASSRVEWTHRRA